LYRLVVQDGQRLLTNRYSVRITSYKQQHNTAREPNSGHL